MKLLRYLAFPLTPIYYIVTWLRNKAFDLGVLSSKSYELPIICVGNLSTGGTGKSPMVSYIISLLKNSANLATLSRGYGRNTKGFILAEEGLTHKDLGDESFQYYTNFKDEISVAVCEDRQYGIENLTAMKPNLEVIVLDDAFQHRKVKAGYNILLTTYNNLFYNDFVLPTGNLRESKFGYKRANSIVVTKCPEEITEEEKKQITFKINPLPKQAVFFSFISYAKKVKSFKKELLLKELPKFTLITGIANAKPLLNYLKSLNLNFTHLEYADHYNFTNKDINKFKDLGLLVTTEKDFMRLQFESALENKLYYLPIEVRIDRQDDFNNLISDFAKG